MRRFEFAVDPKTMKQAYPDAKLPEYATKYSAGADFFAAEEVTILPTFKATEGHPGTEIEHNPPVLVHTGIKAKMLKDEALELFNRSSNPIRRGLVLANSVGLIDADYYNNAGNDGEIMFAFYNFSSEPITIHVGDKVGQGMFTKYLRADNVEVNDKERDGGFGSTDKTWR